MAQQQNDKILELVQDVFQRRDGLKDFLELLLNQVMGEELTAHVGAKPHERKPACRRGYRNGTKVRSLKTRVGELNLTVPQTRDCDPYHPSMFAKWQRSERALLVACAEMYFQGVSTRRVQEVLEEMCGTGVSSMTVSRVASELDEKLSTFRDRNLSGHVHPYLMIDARYEKVRVDGHVVSQAVLVVTGFNESGRREILDWRVGDSESEETWGELFRDLRDRGLQGIQLIVSDAHQGIISAMKRHFQGVAWQRCRVHFKREMAKKVSWKVVKELMADLKAVFAPGERSECLLRSEEMATKWDKRYPKVSKMFREGLEDCLTVLDFPEHHRRRLTSTNMLERLMEEIKRRSRVVGVFPNRASCDRLVGAVLIETDEKWQVEKRPYFNMEHLEDRKIRTTETPKTRRKKAA